MASAATAQGSLEAGIAFLRGDPRLDLIHPRDAEALGGLVLHLVEAGHVEAAQAFCNRLADRAPAEPAPSLDDAAQLAAAGRQVEAEARLSTLLREVPWSAPAALALARLQSDRESGTSEALQMAQRAVRFGGGPEAKALLDHIQSKHL